MSGSAANISSSLDALGIIDPNMRVGAYEPLLVNVGILSQPSTTMSSSTQITSPPLVGPLPPPPTIVAPSPVNLGTVVDLINGVGSLLTPPGTDVPSGPVPPASGGVVPSTSNSNPVIGGIDINIVATGSGVVMGPSPSPVPSGPVGPVAIGIDLNDPRVQSPAGPPAPGPGTLPIEPTPPSIIVTSGGPAEAVGVGLINAISQFEPQPANGPAIAPPPAGQDAPPLAPPLR